MTVISLPKKSSGVIHSPGQLLNALNYIVDPEKTNNSELVSGQNINVPSNALDEMLLTRQLALLTGNAPRKNERFGFHFVQSFSPDDKLTPEQAHEIGLKTMKDYLGESVEFVLATHTDKKHLHNHIILNATNPKTLKKFQQSYLQFDELKEISDRVSAEYGARIIDRTLKNSHKKYQVYLAQNSYRKEIKEKLNFLVRHTSSWEDFKDKAQALGLEVDDRGKYTAYRLTESSQERKIKDRSLKNPALLKENIISSLKKNKISYSKTDVVGLWAGNNTIEGTGQEKEIEILVENWQVQKESGSYLYVTVDFGLERESAIKIPARCIDRLDNGNYRLFIRKQDRFYFVDGDNPEKNRIMPGATVARNLQNQSGNVPLYSNNAAIKLRQLFNEFDFLVSKGLGFDASFEAIGSDLEKTCRETAAVLDQLDKKILGYVEQNKAYARANTGILETIGNLQKEREELRKTLNRVEKDILFYDKSAQRFEAYRQAQKKDKDSPRL